MCIRFLAKLQVLFVECILGNVIVLHSCLSKAFPKGPLRRSIYPSMSRTFTVIHPLLLMADDCCMNRPGLRSRLIVMSVAGAEEDGVPVTAAGSGASCACDC